MTTSAFPGGGSRRLSAFSALFLLIAPTALIHAQPYLVDKEVILPMEASTRKGGTVPLGQTKLESDPHAGAVKVSATRDSVGFVRWFPNHLPLPAELLTQPELKLQVTARGTQSLPVKASWRLKGENAGFGPEVEGTLEPAADGYSVTGLLEVPSVPSGQQPNAISLNFSSTSTLEVTKVALVESVGLLLDIETSTDPWKARPLLLKGEGATPGQDVEITLSPTGRAPRIKADAQGKFTASLPPDQVPAGDGTLRAVDTQSGRASATRSFFHFPALAEKPLPTVTRDGTLLVADGKPFGFVGVNYTIALLGIAREPNYQELVRNLTEMREWGVRAIRVPINFGLIQPEDGVFPDDPRWPDAMKSHNLSPELLPQLEYLVRLAGTYGIYTIIDWHGMPNDPYNYHGGGRNQDRDTGKPGEGISWLAPTKTAMVPFDPGNPRHRKALLDTHTWMARHFKGNGNILGIEVPYNEPHELFMAVEHNWRELTDLAAKAVHAGDPDRLTFTMPSAYGHDNLSPSATWLPPDRVTGGAPHFYLANGPVPVRPDARQFQRPYLARDPAGTFAYAQAAVFMPFSAAEYPIYNGEAGEFGNEDFLPMEKFPDRAEWIIEAQFVQAFAAGWTGVLNWTLWNNEKDFVPYREIYRRVLQRFSPVFSAGALDRSRAQIAFVQNPGAVPPQNGMNHACVPFTRIALALHLPQVHYYSDSHLLNRFRASVPTGLEQVEEGVELTRYKALIVDRRGLDPRAVQLVNIGKVPVLWTDNPETLSPRQVAEFLTNSGVEVDTRTEQDIQLIEGRAHLLVYARGNRDFQTRVYPHIKRAGNFRLVGEDGREVFRGNASQLAQDGIDVSVQRWRTLILAFQN